MLAKGRGIVLYSCVRNGAWGFGSYQRTRPLNVVPLVSLQLQLWERVSTRQDFKARDCAYRNLAAIVFTSATVYRVNNSSGSNLLISSSSCVPLLLCLEIENKPRRTRD